jgi:8-oxo-dGTP diphosphatase
VRTQVHLIRHAKAKNRTEWAEPDELRPLTKRGRREAIAIAERLESDPPGRLVSSPFVRCVQTFEPLAVTLGLPIETTELLAEVPKARVRSISCSRSPVPARSPAARTATCCTT